MKGLGIGRISLEEPGKPLIRVGKPPQHDQGA